MARKRSVYAKAQTSSTIRSTGVTVQSNTANAWTDIISIKTPKGLLWTYLNGSVWVMKLYKSDGSEIAETSKFVIGYRAPGDEVVRPLTEHMLYKSWKELSVDKQMNVNYQQFIKVHFEDGTDKDIPEDVEFVVQLYSPDVVAWQGSGVDSQFYIEIVERKFAGASGEPVYV